MAFSRGIIECCHVPGVWILTTVALRRVACMHVMMDKLGLHVMEDLGPNTHLPNLYYPRIYRIRNFASIDLVRSNEEATSDDRSKKLVCLTFEG